MYQVQLQDFEGPLDLLLFFIKRDEIDIYDIPIARISKQFLDYIHALEQLDLSVASEFIWMASVLMSIKVKMMLPREESETDEFDEHDPRYELVQALLEYKQYKEKAEELYEMDHNNREKFYRGYPEIDKVEWVNDGEVLKNVTLIDLMAAIQSVLTKTPPPPVVHKIEKEKTNIEHQSEYLLSILINRGKQSFLGICLEINDKEVIVITFLAALEMIKEGRILLFIGESPTDFYLDVDEKDRTPTPVLAETL